RLSGPGLSNADDVATLAGGWNGELLDGRGFLPAEIRDGAEQRRAGNEFVETHSLHRPSVRPRRTLRRGDKREGPRRPPERRPAHARRAEPSDRRAGPLECR